MPSKQSNSQKGTVERVMHEFKNGELKSGGRGPKVKNPKQAIAIALHEAGASNRESPAENRSAERKTKAKERKGETAQAEKEGKRAQDRTIAKGRGASVRAASLQREVFDRQVVRSQKPPTVRAKPLSTPRPGGAMCPGARRCRRPSSSAPCNAIEAPCRLPRPIPTRPSPAPRNLIRLRRGLSRRPNPRSRMYLRPFRPSNPTRSPAPPPEPIGIPPGGPQEMPVTPTTPQPTA